MKKRALESKRRHLEAQVAALQAEIDGAESEAQLTLVRQRETADAAASSRREIARLRGIA